MHFSPVEYDLSKCARHLKRIRMLPNVSSHGQTSSPAVHCSLDLVQECLVSRCFGSAGHEDLGEPCRLDSPSKTGRVTSVLDLDRVGSDLESRSSSIRDNLRSGIVLHSLAPRIHPSNSGDSFLMRVFLYLSKLLQHNILVRATQVDGVAYSFRTEAERLFHTTDLRGYRFAFRQTRLPVQLDYQRNLAAVVFLGNSLVEDDPCELSFERDIQYVVRVDVLLVKVGRGAMLEALVVGE